MTENTLSQKMKESFTQMNTEMSWAQAIHAEKVDKRSREGIKINVWDRVWMDTRNISTHRPSKTGNT
jgi:hypothetical protein